MNTRFVAALVAIVGAGVLSAGTAATAVRPLKSHGQLIRHVNRSQSNNWFGYNQGSLEKGNTLFSSIGADWTVPAASRHVAGQDEFSSDWIGIGGGCVDASCTVTDNTLIQTGTEQDFSSGTASYSAWWEVIPGPSLTINMTVAPGDHMHALISEAFAGSNLWTITLRDVTRNETFTQTVPYSSTHLTAEWIEETPLVLSANAGFAALPNLTNPKFDLATVNGAPANLSLPEEVQLIDSKSDVIGSPSAPDSDRDGFGACTWATACAVPSS
jgi:hypothetical protein